ncbi:MAG TPA: cation:proton antiporter [Reyranella sp.]|nr:cation:proton antiporter [Reyranella sp.]
MTGVLFSLLAIALLLTIVSLLVPLAERLRVPHTVLLAVAGLCLGFLANWVTTESGAMGPVRDIFRGLQRLELATDLFLPVFLPPLLFTAGLTIDVRRLMDEVSAVLLLSVVAVLVCIAGVAGALYLVTRADPFLCLLLGAAVSTTDPAAVIGIFREVGAPKRLSILAEGESLFNDAVAIAAFGFVMEILVLRATPDLATHEMPGALGFAVEVFREFAGGIVLGYVLARLAMFVLPRLGESRVAIASVTVSLAYASYIVGENYLHVSGVITVVMAALTVANYGPTSLHPRFWTALRELWEQLEFWSNCLIFVLASMVAAGVLPRISWLYVGGLVAVGIGAFLARAAVIFGLLPILEAGKLVQPINRPYKIILVWGGLRGAVTIVLAMVAAGDQHLSEESREFAAVLATLFVFYTLFINATTLGLVMHFLGLNKLSRVELALRDRVLALSRANVALQMQEVMRVHNAQVERLDVDPASAGEPEIEAAPPELALGLDERLKVGLLTLCTQEKELYLDLFEQQTLSRRMAAVLSARADRLTDSVRDRGVAGYQEVMRSFANPVLIVRIGLWLHRHFGYERVLTEGLADRFEVLMVSQQVLGELASFNTNSVADLLGAEAEQRLGELIGERQELIANALQALSLQYPGYAESIRDRQFERAAIRFESAEYSRRLREGIIGREVYADLRRQLNTRRRAIAQRPSLRLGLELQAMMARVPLLAALDGGALAELGKRLRLIVALPGEKIVAEGARPDAIYFIAGGEVNVLGRGAPVTLREGEFFGEIGLLESQPRTADVLSSGYSHLLVLYRRDFHRLMEKRPEIRAEIEAVAARRTAENKA